MSKAEKHTQANLNASLALFSESISAAESPPCALRDPAVPYLEPIIGFMGLCAERTETLHTQVT